LKNVLWLASWFPNKLDPLSGDFLERHARSASLLNRITVLFIVKNTVIGSRRVIVEKKQENANLLSIILYYKPLIRIRFFEQLISGFQYFFFQRKLIHEYFKQNGKPDLVNVHISFKAGIGALYCKWRYGVKYVISEQWTIFCPEAHPAFNDQNFIARWLMKLIYKNAAHISAVSEYLGKTLQDRFNIKEPLRIPNVVDTKLFHPEKRQGGIFRFIHISLLNLQKSPAEIFKAVSLLKNKTSSPFEFIVYGPLLPQWIELVNNYQLNSVVQFRGEVMQDVLAKELRLCNALILYSRFETFGCVIIEAYASGVPVIVSQIEVMKEIVDENITGIFVPLDDPESLARKMLWMMENHEQFDGIRLSQLAEEKYSYKKVAEQFDSFYNSVQ
jgi:glycosyltransferase involved in cell wall biosynthesis